MLALLGIVTHCFLNFHLVLLSACGFLILHSAVSLFSIALLLILACTYEAVFINTACVSVKIVLA